MTTPEGRNLLIAKTVSAEECTKIAAHLLGEQCRCDPKKFYRVEVYGSSSPVPPQAEQPVTACNLRFKTWVPQSIGGSMLADVVPAEHFDNELSRLRTELEELRAKIKERDSLLKRSSASEGQDPKEWWNERARLLLDTWATASPATINQQGEE